MQGPSYRGLRDPSQLVWIFFFFFLKPSQSPSDARVFGGWNRTAKQNFVRMVPFPSPHFSRVPPSPLLFTHLAHVVLRAPGASCWRDGDPRQRQWTERLSGPAAAALVLATVLVMEVPTTSLVLRAPPQPIASRCPGEVSSALNAARPAHAPATAQVALLGDAPGGAGNPGCTDQEWAGSGGEARRSAVGDAASPPGAGPL